MSKRPQHQWEKAAARDGYECQTCGRFFGSNLIFIHSRTDDFGNALPMTPEQLEDTLHTLTWLNTEGGRTDCFGPNAKSWTQPPEKRKKKS